MLRKYSCALQLTINRLSLMRVFHYTFPVVACRFSEQSEVAQCSMRFRLNKAYLIIALTAIFVLAAMLTGPLIRKRAREKAGQTVPATTPQGK